MSNQLAIVFVVGEQQHTLHLKETMTHTELRQLMKSLNVTYSKTPKTAVMMADLEAMCLGQSSLLPATAETVVQTAVQTETAVQATAVQTETVVQPQPQEPAMETTTAVTATVVQTATRETATRWAIVALSIVSQTLDSVLLTTVLAAEAAWENRHYLLYQFSLALAVVYLVATSRQAKLTAAVSVTVVLTTTVLAVRAARWARVTSMRAVRQTWATAVWLAQPELIDR